MDHKEVGREKKTPPCASGAAGGRWSNSLFKHFALSSQLAKRFAAVYFILLSFSGRAGKPDSQSVSQSVDSSVGLSLGRSVCLTPRFPAHSFSPRPAVSRFSEPTRDYPYETARRKASFARRCPNHSRSERVVFESLEEFVSEFASERFESSLSSSTSAIALLLIGSSEAAAPGPP